MMYCKKSCPSFIGGFLQNYKMNNENLKRAKELKELELKVQEAKAQEENNAELEINIEEPSHHSKDN